jgi:hypothetical protein
VSIGHRERDSRAPEFSRLYRISRDRAKPAERFFLLQRYQLGSYITIQDLVNALSPSTVLALFDDQNINIINDPPLVAVVESVIARAEAEVNSYLARAYPKLKLPVTQAPQSQMLKQAALAFAVPFSFQRHPEYVKTYGDDPRGGMIALKRADEFMERLCTGKQFLNDVPAEPKPSIVGGIVYSPGPRTTIDSPDGTYNGGDF